MRRNEDPLSLSLSASPLSSPSSDDHSADPMKLAVSFFAASLLAALLPSVAAQDDTPELTIQTTFPNDAFSRVSNGQANRVVFTISPPRTGADSDRILTLESITGAFLNRNKEGKKGYVMRNVSQKLSDYAEHLLTYLLIAETDDSHKIQVSPAQGSRWQTAPSAVRLLPRIQAPATRC